MARYKKIDVRMWGDEKFKALSSPQPNAQTLWVYFLTGPVTNNIPGLIPFGEMAIAEKLNWPLKAFREAFNEVLDKGMAKVNRQAQLIWIPNAISYNTPESPNVITSWRVIWDEIPECDLKAEAYQVLKAFLEGFHEAFTKAFLEALAKPSGKPLANQKQEQEQKQEHKQEQNINKDRYLDFVLLTPEEHKKLMDKFGGEKTKHLIEKLNNYIGSKGKKYSSHYHTILNWETKDNGNSRTNQFNGGQANGLISEPGKFAGIGKKDTDFGQMS